MVHLFCHGTVQIAMLSTFMVLYTSFLKADGPVFMGGFGFESCLRIWRTAPEAIGNSFLFSLPASIFKFGWA